ncbi:anti-sigma factor [Patescibacteria group bacterium]|nr:MAG: anti-sigma factor [Patescibacteria group bacterium]
MKYTPLLALVALLCIGGGCALDRTSSDSTEPAIDRNSVLVEARENGLIMSESEVNLMSQTSPTIDPAVRVTQDIQTYLKANVRDWFSAALADVTGGSSFGIAHSQFASGIFTLVVEMGNLPEPASGYFYEGWLVERDEEPLDEPPLRLISIGRAQKTEDGYAMVYRSGTDLTEYNFFVLTLEPDDGNSTPAEHILEGTLK